MFTSGVSLTTATAWIGLIVVALWVAGMILTDDFRSRPRVGDTSSYVLQIVSFADSGDLTYDTDDYRDYVGLGWGEPVGVFMQRHGEGWAAAKPWLYTAVVALPHKVFDNIGRAVALTNLAIIAGIGVLAVATLRPRVSGAAVPVLVLAFLFGSHVWLYAFEPYVDLFIALGVAVLCWAFLTVSRKAQLWPALVWAVVAGIMLPEKPPLLVVIAPMFILVLLRLGRWQHRIVVISVLAASLTLAVLPYLWLSEGRSWQAYGGERYYVSGRLPFADPPGLDAPGRSSADRAFSLEFIRGRLSSDWAGSLRAVAYTVAGRHTGALVFFPLSLVVVALALRHAHKPEVAVLLSGIIGYVLFYAILFPTNFYGGGAALGNRYFLQVCPLVIALAAAAPISGRLLVPGALASIIAACIFLYPHFVSPRDSIIRIDRTSPAQSLLPFESNQEGVIAFRCGSTYMAARGMGSQADYLACVRGEPTS